jgi:hypothetical protein
MPEKRVRVRLLVYRKENLMNTLIKKFGIFAVLSLLISSCGALTVQAGQEKGESPKAAVYESILGRPLTDQAVADFVAENTCSSTAQFLLCNSVGMALRTGSNQTVETIYLYLNSAEGFEPYKGALPLGLKFYDNLAAVEYKLDRQGLGNRGLPDEAAVPDHMHYQATYHEAGLTIIYNYPFPDEDATIYAIMVTSKKGPR